MSAGERRENGRHRVRQLAPRCGIAPAAKSRRSRAVDVHIRVDISGLWKEHPPPGISPGRDGSRSVEIRASNGVQKASLAATLVSAFAASICCIGPLAAALLGLTGLGALVKYEPYRPYFTSLTLALLAGAFYLTYRSKPHVECTPGALCEEAGPGRIENLNRAVLWAVTGIVLLVLTFPTWSSWIWG